MDGVLPGYLWIFPLGGKRANIGLGILPDDLIRRKRHRTQSCSKLSKATSRLRRA